MTVITAYLEGLVARPVTTVIAASFEVPVREPRCAQHGRERARFESEACSAQVAACRSAVAAHVSGTFSGAL